MVTKVTEEEYLAFDRAAEVRSEFLDGQMTRSGEGAWTFHAYEQPAGQVKLDSIGAGLSLSRIYDGVEFDAPSG